MSQEFTNCSCCKRCTPLGQGLCTKCKPSAPNKDDGCTPNGIGGWKRSERCRVRSSPAKRRLDKPRDPRCTGRPQSTRKTVQCRWCTRRFPVWTKSRKTGKKVSWHPAIRSHCQRQHAFELTDWRIANPLLMVASRSEAKQERVNLIQEAAMRMRRGR